MSLETLVDSPVYAGAYVRRIELDPPGTPRPVALNLVADDPSLLEASEAQIQAHRNLVVQADRLFGARHFAHYDFLLALSDRLSRIGLEHHESSENGVSPAYFKDWARRPGPRDLLPHEYTHSWNGKFRRPADLWTPSFEVPMQDSLLWVYEGQTQFWGRVLAARSGPDLDRADALHPGQRRGLDRRPLGPRLAQPAGHDQRGDDLEPARPQQGLGRLAAQRRLLRRVGR